MAPADPAVGMARLEGSLLVREQLSSTLEHPYCGDPVLSYLIVTAPDV